jgi:hypothetical protein
MGIKNWTITAEGTKSASAREVYLNDKKHPNHKNTEGYLDVFGSDNTTLNIIRNTERHKLETARKRKGGRPPLEATEFVMTFPKGIRPDKEQWKRMLGMVLIDVAKSVGVERKDLAQVCRAVAHQQDQNPDKKGSGDHMHVMLGRFTNDGKYLRKLQSKSTLYRMKQSFNLAALEVMGVNHATYEPVKTYQGVAKRRVPKWRADAGKTWDKLKQQHKANITNGKRLKEWYQNNVSNDELLKLKAAKIDDEIENNKNVLRIIDKFYGQAQKWLKAFKDEDLEQQNRQRNRMERAIDELGAFTVREEDERFIEDMLKQINSKTDKPIETPSQKKTPPRMKFR